MNWRILFSGPGIIVLITLLVLFLFFGILLYSNVGQKELPTIDEQPIKTITKQEASYPPAKKQDYRNTGNDTGFLVVTSTVSDVFVIIDAEDEPEVPTGSLSASLYNPPQYPPFTIKDIPVGTHTLIAAKSGYVAKEYSVIIKENEVTRLTVTLDPISK